MIGKLLSGVLADKKFIVSMVIAITLFAISDYRSISYDEQKYLLEESAKKSAQIVIDINIEEEIYNKTGYTSTEIIKIADEFKENAKNDYDRGLAYFNLGEYNSAIYFFSESLKYTTSGNNAEYYIGTSYIALKKYDAAREWLQKCTDDFQCLSQIGGAYALEGDYKNAVLYYEKSSSIIPTPIDDYNLGTIYAKMGCNESFQKALFYFDQALKFNDEQFEIVGIKRNNVEFNKAYVLMKLSKYEEAKTLFEKIESNGRSDSGIFVNLAIVNLQLRNSFKSEEYAKKAIKIEPNNVDAHKVLIISYYDTQRYDDLIREYETNKEILSDLNSLSFVGGAYSASGLPEIGIPIILSTLNNPKVNLEMAYVSLGASYAMINDKEKALFYTNKALIINPYNKEANTNLKTLIG